MSDVRETGDELTGRQRRVLRALGRRMSAGGHVGKAGLTDGAVKAIARLFEKDELVKVRLAERESDKRKEMSGQLARALGAVSVAAVGRTVLLYKRNDDLPGEDRVAV